MKTIYIVEQLFGRADWEQEWSDWYNGNLNVLLKRFDCFCNVVLGLDIVFQRFARVVQRNASDRKQEHKVLIDVAAREILED